MICLFMLHGRETRVWHGFFPCFIPFKSLQPSWGQEPVQQSPQLLQHWEARVSPFHRKSPEGRAIHHSSNEHRCHIGGWKMIPYANHGGIFQIQHVHLVQNQPVFCRFFIYQHHGELIWRCIVSKRRLFSGSMFIWMSSPNVDFHEPKRYCSHFKMGTLISCNIGPPNS